MLFPNALESLQRLLRFNIDPILVSQHYDPLHSGVMDIPGSISDHNATFIYIYSVYKYLFACIQTESLVL